MNTADIDLAITSRSGLPLTVAAYLLRALGHAYPGTSIGEKQGDEVMRLHIPRTDVTAADPNIDLDSLVPDKDDPATIAFTHGISPSHGAGVIPPPWLAALLQQMAASLDEQMTASHVPNYLDFEILGTDDGQRESFHWIVCRRGRKSPHQLREEAEARVAMLEARLRDLGVEVN